MSIHVRETSVPETELEQSAFCTSDELITKTLDEESKTSVRWQKIPERYSKLEVAEIKKSIAIARKELGERVVILGHHYQRDDVIEFADYTGDSFKLSQIAASQDKAEYIVFCGVHFMAETADILSTKGQKVILPNITAGCSMADMARIDDVIVCWNALNNTLGAGSGLVPTAYMNSTASAKALCGRSGGVVCTSSNAVAAFKWAFKHGSRILFIPDQHLGRNTGTKLGIKLNEMVVWNPFKPLGGNTEDALRKANLILWQGHCSVHTRFTVSQVEEARQKYPDVKVIVHPECRMEVVQAADLNGSTEYIVKVVKESKPGTTWAIGTEINLVNRLAHTNPDKKIFCLSSIICPCTTMYRIHPAYLLWVLDSLKSGEVVNQITVEQEVSVQAKVALDRMLSIT